MDRQTREQILTLSRTAHDLTEAAYQQHPAAHGDAEWIGKQRILLADMALHLLQTALKENDLSQDSLKRNLFSILTIADQFVDGHDLKLVADQLYSS